MSRSAAAVLLSAAAICALAVGALWHDDKLEGFYATWMFLGVIVWGHLGLLAVARASSLDDLLFISYMLLPIYAWHQLEENGYDVLGRRYAFVRYVNSLYASVAGATPDPERLAPLTPRATLWVNILVVWFAYLLVVYISSSTQRPWAVLTGASIMGVNAVSHIVPTVVISIRQGVVSISPGCVSAVLGFVPFSAYVAVIAYAKGWLVSERGFLLFLAVGVLFHLVLVPVMLLPPPAVAQLLILFVEALTPLIMDRAFVCKYGALPPVGEHTALLPSKWPHDYTYST